MKTPSVKRYFIASAYSLRAGHRKKALDYCKHKHRTFKAAQRCADKQPTKLAPKVYRHWKAKEILLVPVLRGTR